MSDVHEELAARAAWLREAVERANYEYHALYRPSIYDREYDSLFRELQTLERDHPTLRTADSPTQRVGAPPQSQLAKHEHRIPMLSLGNAFDDDELRAWEDRLVRLVGESARSAGYSAELKIDGTAVSLTYQDGVLVTGATRGNGAIGEVVTPNLRTIREVPLRLRGTGWPALVEIRGEVYIPFSAFERMNEARVAAGEPVFANPRNAAAGALRQLDPEVSRARPLRFFAYAASAVEGTLPVRLQTDLLDRLAEWGMPIAPQRRKCDSLDDVAKHAHFIEHEGRAALDFAIDGLVVKVNPFALQDELGVVGGREPRWAIARKFAPDIATTRLNAISVNVGRTGVLTPFAELEPVEIGGATVRLATLHNEDYVATKQLMVGDLVQVKRAGEVIPQVIGPVAEERTGAERPWRMPSKCPRCGTPVRRDEDEAATYCPNVACPGRQLEGLVHFASRDALDIRGLSYARLEQLVEAGMVRDAADIFTLTAEQLVTLERFAKKSADNLVAAISDARTRPLSRLVYALGIRHVGVSTAQLLARHFGTIDALANASSEEMAEIHGVGEVVAEAVAEYFADPAACDLVERLRSLGVRMDEPRKAASGGALRGLTVVITGTLPTLKRSEATALVEANGGKVTSSVSKATSFVVAGDEAGGKLEKAQALGIEVIDEAELLRRVGR